MAVSTIARMAAATAPAGSMTPEQALLRVDPLPRSGARHRVQDQGVRPCPRRRPQHRPDEIAERAEAEHADRPRRDRRRRRRSRHHARRWHGEEPTYLAKIEAESQVSITEAGAACTATRCEGDCHLHSTWSDGGAPIEAMAATAIALGHEYMVLTDHSARLTIAHGLDEERLTDQLDRDRSDQRRHRRRRPRLPDPDRAWRSTSSRTARSTSPTTMLERLDVVVASVHSKLRMEKAQMTERMVLAVASPARRHPRALHRPDDRQASAESQFDADYVFAACAQFNTAVEINCRPERLDPPRELIDVAIEYGCWFSIDSDAHATGQLEWQPLGCDRAAEREVPIERIINTMPADDLLAWTADRPRSLRSNAAGRSPRSGLRTSRRRRPSARPAPRVSPVVPSPIRFIT